MGVTSSIELPIPKVVLVPPMVERDVRSRNRFTKPSYDYMFCKKQIEHLLGDFQRTGIRGCLMFSPPEDRSISIKAALGLHRSSMALRHQADPSLPYNFVDIKAATGQGSGGLTVRASFFDMANGLGVFAAVPCLTRTPKMAQLGLRYSSPTLTCGLMATPQNASLSTAWMCGRMGHWSAGVKLSTDQTPVVELPRMAKFVSVSDVAEWVHQHASMILAYSPVFNTGSTAASSGRFTASVEVQESRNLVVSFFQHFAIVRRVVNPMEKDNVVGITNYLDICMQISTPMSALDAGSGSQAELGKGSTPPVASSSMKEKDAGVNIGASWQINKNWLVKGRVGDSSAAAAVVLRSWMSPSFLVLGFVQYRYHGGPIQFGVKVQMENFGALRYERGTKELHGRALLQRHVASSADLANHEGDTGTVVQLDASEEEYSPRKGGASEAASSFL